MTHSDGESSRALKPLMDRKRAAVGGLVILAVLVAALFAIYRERHSFTDSFRHVGASSMLVSYVLGAVCVLATWRAWLEVLRGLGVPMPSSVSARVFFVSQLGKYIPGSVWPAVMQMEAGRARGANRWKMLGANLVTIAIGCCIGLIVACSVIPFYDTNALTKFWWALLALPLLLVALYPRVLHASLNLVLRILRRPPLVDQLSLRSELRAAGWYVVSWAALGAHLGVLAASVGSNRLSVYFLCVGAMALGMSLGILFIPVPAGAGVRDLILVLVLGSVMKTGQALAVAVASRAILIGCDITLAVVAALLTRSRRDLPVLPARSGRSS